MRIRARIWKNLLCFAVCTAVLQCASPGQAPATPAPPPAGGITQAAEDLAKKALDLLNSGKLKDAADLYSKLLNDYKNTAMVPEACSDLR